MRSDELSEEQKEFYSREPERVLEDVLSTMPSHKLPHLLPDAITVGPGFVLPPSPSYVVTPGHDMLVLGPNYQLARKAPMYSMANADELTRVVAAADALWKCQAEFENDPGACSEWMDALDQALEKCPGTAAWHHVRRPLPPIEELIGDTGSS